MKLCLPLLFILATGLLPASEPTSPTPGTVVTLDFPELGAMHDQLPAACQVHIPASYDPAKAVPLLVWFGGGKGTQHTSGARELVDFDQYVVVAIPYPNGKDVRAAAKDGTLDEHWKFQRPMLTRLRELVPNIDPAMRIVAGTSNGGHLIGFGLDRAWPGFADYFTAFVIHEGGMQPMTTDIPNARDKRVLVVYGEKSPSIVWTGWFCWNLQRSGADATFIALPAAGHGLNTDGRRAIRQWIDTLTPR